MLTMMMMMMMMMIMQRTGSNGEQLFNIVHNLRVKMDETKKTNDMSTNFDD